MNKVFEYDTSTAHDEPRYKSPKDIRIALGLMSWDDWRLAQIKHFLGRDALYLSAAEALDVIDNKRASGRTTKILISAIYTAQTQKVLIMGRNTQHGEDLARKAIEMCQHLKMYSVAKNIRPLVVENHEMPFIHPDVKLFPDHAVKFEHERKRTFRH
jgi:hypothetical protein